MNPSTAILWQRVRSELAAGLAAAAVPLLKAILAIDPNDVQAHLHLCGLLAPRAATIQALAAARLPITDEGTLGDVVAALLWTGEIVAARRLLASPLIATSREPSVLTRAAGQRQAIGEHAEALVLMDRARAAGAGGCDFLFHHAVQLAFNGNTDAAYGELEQCIAIDPPRGRAFVELARMRTQTVENNHLVRIDAALAQARGDDLDHAALEFARYKELEDLERHAEAWQALARGNARMHRLLPSDAARDSQCFDRLIEACDARFLADDLRPTSDGAQPIFIIGMPRSGTTLLERMLGNHSRIANAGELGDFPRALQHATDHVAPLLIDDIILQRLRGIEWAALGQAYLAETRWRAGGKAFFTDKLPRNWMLAGLIPRALPGAKILHLVRDPMDVCFSNWRALFGPGPEYAYSYDLEALAAHYQQYRRVMAHWHTTLPGTILDVDYARLTCEPEAVLREVLAFCQLDYEHACVDLAANHAPSATLSMAQVRDGLRRDTANAWRPYAAQLLTFQHWVTDVPQPDSR